MLKKIQVLLVLTVSIWINKSVAQTTLVLQPDSVLGKDHEVFSLLPTTNYNTNVLRGNAFTFNGDPGTQRGLFQFDLSSIPSNATILLAELYLFSPDSPHTQYQYGLNEAIVQRITSTWTENGVTWNNQPNVTALHQVTLATSTSNYQNYTHIPVTAMVQDMVANPATSFGFELRLLTEQEYRRITFASSRYPNATKRPKLEITYRVVETVGIPENTRRNSVAIFPNPCTDRLSWFDNSGKTENVYALQLVNTMGDVVLHKTLQSNDLSDIDLSKISPAIYTCIITGSDGTVISLNKLVKL